ncbi:hypothetical protein [Phenylobacterium sp.]|uniref:hypothetical protein n=1 Tax=Phenylobacterium sp. TaxID=1871053 RepID=UPI0025EC49D1|nr:hypothetical protein [Phenylobacterium sp.]MBX3482287.1 hypothetical protein [Phenylobacterium sp.]
MSADLAITAEDALGLADVAQVQLRLAKRFGERAEAEEDVDKACKLARACERAARGYRQSLLLKSRLFRDAENARCAAVETPRPRTAPQQARINKRVRELYTAVEDHIYAEVEAERLDEAEFYLEGLLDTIERLAQADDAFADGDFEAQVAVVCDHHLPPPELRSPPPQAQTADAEAPAAADSS